MRCLGSGTLPVHLPGPQNGWGCSQPHLGLLPVCERPASALGAPQRGEADAKSQEGARAGRKDEVRVVQRRLKP